MVVEKMAMFQGRCSASSWRYRASEWCCLSSFVKRSKYRYYRIMNPISLCKTLRATWLAEIQLQENVAQSCIVKVKKDYGYYSWAYDENETPQTWSAASSYRCSCQCLRSKWAESHQRLGSYSSLPLHCVERALRLHGSPRYLLVVSMLLEKWPQS